MNPLIQSFQNSSHNFTRNDTQDFYTLPEDEKAIASVLYGIFGSIGMLENILVFTTFYTCGIQLDIPSNWFVLSLALADGIISFVALLVGFVTFTSNVGLDVLFSFAMQASSGNLFFLTLNRFISVYKSLQYPKYMTVTRAKCFVCVSWAVPVLSAIVITLSVITDTEELYYLVMSYYVLLTFATIVLNVYLISKAYQQRKQIKKQYFITGQQNHLKKEFRLFLRLFIVSATFFTGSIPSIVILYMHPTRNDRNSVTFIRSMLWIFLIVSINAAIDPFIYFFNSSVFNVLRMRITRYLNLRSNRVGFAHHANARSSRPKVFLVSRN